MKANVFLRDIEDVPAFNQIWSEAFGGHPPATAITPTSKPGFAIEDSRIEINLVAIHGGTYAPHRWRPRRPHGLSGTSGRRALRRPPDLLGHDCGRRGTA